MIRLIRVIRGSKSVQSAAVAAAGLADSGHVDDRLHGPAFKLVRADLEPEPDRGRRVLRALGPIELNRPLATRFRHDADGTVIGSRGVAIGQTNRTDELAPLNGSFTTNYTNRTNEIRLF